MRGRLYNSRAKGNAAFLVIRDQTHTLQACGFVNAEETPNVTKEMVKFINWIPKESIIDVTGQIRAAKVDSCSIKDWEFNISDIHVVTTSTQTLPFQISDANNSVLNDPNEDETKKDDKDKQINVLPDTRLNNRWLDLRTETSQSIMRVKTKIAAQFRNFCLQNDFVEIFTPKLIPGASEGGSAVFELK